MEVRLLFTPEADEKLSLLENDRSQKAALNAVRKCLGLMEKNLRHPSLQTHKYNTLAGPNGETVFESYAQQKTASAYRVFWYYGPATGQITIVTIVPHP